MSGLKATQMNMQYGQIQEQCFGHMIEIPQTSRYKNIAKISFTFVVFHVTKILQNFWITWVFGWLGFMAYQPL